MASNDCRVLVLGTTTLLLIDERSSKRRDQAISEGRSPQRQKCAHNRHSSVTDEVADGLQPDLCRTLDCDTA